MVIRYMTYKYFLLWLSGIGSPANAGDAGSTPGSDPLEKEMSTHSRILAWRIPIRGVTEESDMTGRLNNSSIQ